MAQATPTWYKADILNPNSEYLYFTPKKPSENKEAFHTFMMFQKL